MLVDIEPTRHPDTAARSPGGWSAVAAAWSLAILLAVAFATAELLGSRQHTPAANSALAGAVIPRHDPSVPGPSEVAASDWLERLRVETYAGF
jgi:hypothetical protein